MKKRMFSILTALTLCLTLLPTMVWAAETGAAAWTVTIDGVAWVSDADFDRATPGEYVYTPVLPEGYTLAEGMEPPTITVTVEAAPDTEDKPPQDTLGETPPETGEPVTYDTGDKETPAFSGVGTAENPYEIITPADLQTLATNVNAGTSYSGEYCVLTTNIDLSEVCGEIVDNSTSWTHIGSNSFQGAFDGNGHTVSNLYITSSTVCAGLFGYVRAGTVKKLNVEGEVTVRVTDMGTAYVGGVVGYALISAVENCSFSGGVTGACTVDATLRHGLATTPRSKAVSSTRIRPFLSASRQGV